MRIFGTRYSIRNRRSAAKNCRAHRLLGGEFFLGVGGILQGEALTDRNLGRALFKRGERRPE
jgi:hypothetical protein